MCAWSVRRGAHEARHRDAARPVVTTGDVGSGESGGTLEAVREEVRGDGNHRREAGGACRHRWRLDARRWRCTGDAARGAQVARGGIAVRGAGGVAVRSIGRRDGVFGAGVVVRGVSGVAVRMGLRDRAGEAMVRIRHAQEAGSRGRALERDGGDEHNDQQTTEAQHGDGC